MSVVGSPGSPVVLMTVVLNVQVRCEGSRCEVCRLLRGVVVRASELACRLS